jgi:hypothetical protein
MKMYGAFLNHRRWLEVFFHLLLDCVWIVMAHVQKPDFVSRRNGRVHLNRQGRQFIRLLAGELCTSAGTARASPCSAVMWRLLAAHSILLFPLHFSRASPCAITFQTQSTSSTCWKSRLQARLHKIWLFTPIRGAWGKPPTRLDNELFPELSYNRGREINHINFRRLKLMCVCEDSGRTSQETRCAST